MYYKKTPAKLNVCTAPDCWTKNLTIGVFCMTKYDYELKKRVVTAYLNGCIYVAV